MTAAADRYGIGFWLAVGWLLLVAMCALFANVLPVRDPLEPVIANRLAVPFTDNWLGADGLGRDMLSRLVHGARVSVVIALTAVSIGMIIGGTLGMAVGFFRGKFERIVMAAVDVILAFPGLLLLLALVFFVGQSLATIAIVIGFLSIPAYTRIARANTLAVVQREFVLAARAMGARAPRILFREILPNVALPVMAFGLVAMGVIIVIEGALAFLGLSVEAPQPTWGGMIAEGKRHLSRTVHVALIPSIVMFLTVLSLNFVGDQLRSRIDVRESNL
jgi:peptide/nickel transport system permease protein